MLEVKVVKHGATGELNEIAHMRIDDDGSGDSVFSSYDVFRTEAGGDYAEEPTKGRVQGHNRHQSVWKLVAKALRVGT